MSAEPERIVIRGEYITLGQFLKLVGQIGSGWEAKVYLAEARVWINGELDDRRGRKIRGGDRVEFEDGSRFVVVADEGWE